MIVPKFGKEETRAKVISRLLGLFPQRNKSHHDLKISKQPFELHEQTLYYLILTRTF